MFWLTLWCHYENWLIVLRAELYDIVYGGEEMMSDKNRVCARCYKTQSESGTSYDTYLVSWFHKHLVVLGERDEEDDRRYILKTMYPLPSLWSLSSDVHHSANNHDSQVWIERFGGENGLHRFSSMCFFGPLNFLSACTVDWCCLSF